MQLYRRQFKAMGSPCEIQLYAHDPAAAERIIGLAIADIERLEKRYSRYRDDSYLSAINRIAAVGGALEVDDETAGLLNYADTCYRESGGLFDITSGLLRRAWRFDREAVPDAATINDLLDRIGWQRLRWTPPTLEFGVTGMEMDFGGVVKEYAADRAVGICRDAGAAHGLVNLGGDIRIIGPQPDGGAWNIGIRHPARPGEIIRTLGLKSGGLTTSGDYARCVVVNGVRYGHVLNPKTGWPVAYLASVSVVSDVCLVAGSASTIAMLKERDGPAWLTALGLPHLWIDVEGKIGGTLV